MVQQNNLYCEKCDKWLDNPNDYEKTVQDDVGTFYKCKSCGNKDIVRDIVNSSFVCGCCFKSLGKLKPNKPN